MATVVTGAAPEHTVTAEDIAQRLDGLPFLPFHLKIIATLGFGTFFDAFDVLSMATAMTMIVASFKLDFGQGGALLSAAAGGPVRRGDPVRLRAPSISAANGRSSSRSGSLGFAR